MANDRLIQDAAVEKALDWLRDNATAIAEAKSEMVFCEEYRKSMKAILMQEHLSKPVSAQEREAYADDRYVGHLEKLKQAVFKYEELRALREAAAMKIEAWRTEAANYRAMKV